MGNFHEADPKKKNQTLRSLIHKLDESSSWKKETVLLSKSDIEGLLYSWLKMSDYEKEKRLYMDIFYNFYDYLHNMIAKIEANII